MAQPSLEFLCICIASALLDHVRTEHPPIPIREILQKPPPDLKEDLSLTEALPFGDAVWMRTLGGVGSVFANPSIPEPQRRFAMARALFVGLCSSDTGRAAGLPLTTDDNFQIVSLYFARCLLMPRHLLPEDWEAVSPEQLAAQFVVPVESVHERLRELHGNGHHTEEGRAD